MVLRLMSTEEYAVYALVFGVQSTLGILMDLGFGGAVIALGGPHHNDKELLGGYVAAASYLRRWLFLILALGTVALIPYAVANWEFGGSRLIVLVPVILIVLFFQSWAAYYDAPLILNGRVKEYYAPAVVGAAARLVLCAGLARIDALSALTATLVSICPALISGVGYRFLSRSLISLPSALQRPVIREMTRYLLPLVPATLYFAFQSQISLFLIATFGGIEATAQVAAVGRLGQLFLILNMSSSVLLAPFIAKTEKDRLASRFAWSGAAVISVAVTLTSLCYYFPDLFLWILGPRYHGIRAEVKLVILSASLSYISSAMWAVNTARRWVVWWSGGAQAALAVGTQIVCIFVYPIATATGVLTMGVWVSAAPIVIQSLLSFLGLRGLIRGSGPSNG
jgi:O-antigen/teichoic acid export membrane protein